MSKLNATTLLFGCLFWFVGLSSWITITALFSELSLMINDLPEKYEIFSMLALTIQLANIIPLLYSICIPESYKTTTFIQYTGYIIISASFSSILFMAYFYNYIMVIFSSPHSVMLFIATFFASTCDCMTSMVYWVWASSYPSQYIAFLSAGEPSSGIVSSILIWIQQIQTNEARFSVKTYYLIIASLLPLSLIAFFILNKLLEYGYFETQSDWIDISPTKNKDENSKLINGDGIQSYSNDEESGASSSTELNVLNKLDKKYECGKWVVLVGLISAIQNGTLPSISSYALIPYHGSVYVYAITMSNILKPFMAIITAYFPNKLITQRSIVICCVIWALCVVYICFIALQSPNPIGKDNECYMGLIIMIFVLCNGMLTLAKTCVIMIVKKEFMKQSRSLSQIDINLKIIWDRQIGGVMERIGVGIQVGSFVGALLFFILINEVPVKLFHD